MKTLYFTPNYYFKGKLWFEPLKKLAEGSFMRIRNKWVNMVKPYYEEINALWSIRHPELKNVTMEGDIFDEYNQYAAKMANSMLISEYKRYPGNWLFIGMSNPETADFRLVCRFDKNMYVDYDMTPIEVGPT